jgi:hypothetical protein
MPNNQVADTMARRAQLNDYGWRYMTGGIVLGVMCMMHFNEIVYSDKLANHACKLTSEYAGLATDICIFHNGSIVNTITQRLDGIMVIKQHTGEIRFNQSLACSINALLPYFTTNRNYCGELNDFIRRNTDNHRENGESRAVEGVINWLFPNATNTISYVIPCKINQDLLSSDYINTAHMQHLCKTIKVSKGGRIFMYIIVFTIYITLCMNHYDEIVNNIPPIDIPLPNDATCVITYEPIRQKQIYYKCERCIAVYDYAAIRHNWLHYSKNCSYCSMPIRELTKFRNVPSTL